MYAKIYSLYHGDHELTGLVVLEGGVAKLYGTAHNIAKTVVPWTSDDDVPVPPEEGLRFMRELERTYALPKYACNVEIVAEGTAPYKEVVNIANDPALEEMRSSAERAEMTDYLKGLIDQPSAPPARRKMTGAEVRSAAPKAEKKRRIMQALARRKMGK